jgi:hypothetical protein
MNEQNHFRNQFVLDFFFPHFRMENSYTQRRPTQFLAIPDHFGTASMEQHQSRITLAKEPPRLWLSSDFRFIAGRQQMFNER